MTLGSGKRSQSAMSNSGKHKSDFTSPYIVILVISIEKPAASTRRRLGIVLSLVAADPPPGSWGQAAAVRRRQAGRWYELRLRVKGGRGRSTIGLCGNPGFATNAMSTTAMPEDSFAGPRSPPSDRFPWCSSDSHGGRKAKTASGLGAATRSWPPACTLHRARYRYD